MSFTYILSKVEFLVEFLFTKMDMGALSNIQEFI